MYVHDVRALRENFYASNHKIEQDTKLSHFISATPIARRRSTQEKPKKRNFAVHYFLPKYVTKKKLQVCQSFFLAALDIKKDRVNRIAAVLFEGAIPKEKRGGDRLSDKSRSKKESVREFINSLSAKESHYNRRKSKRLYLSSDLSIKRLHKIYQEKCDSENKVSFEMFRRVFVTDFNISFSSPASDCCAKCTRLTYLIKKEKDEQKKNDLKMEKIVHKKRANAFYDLLKANPPNSLTFCFDLQQVQPLPRTPINDAFYSQQISLYVFCCVDSGSKHPTFFMWSEDQAGRGSKEVGSALISYLNSLDLANVKVLRLFCDGCGGQNKNSHIVHLLYFWLRFKSPSHLTDIQLTFPVRGHSFLPADRVFGRVEKILKRHPTITSCEKYEEIYSEVGTVKRIGEDWKLLDIKELEHWLKKIKGISDAKRIYLKKTMTTSGVTSVKACTYENFKFSTGQERYEKLLKAKCEDEDMRLNEVALSRGIPEKKKASLKMLMLAQFGEEWEKSKDLEWYNNLLNEPVANNEGTEDTQEGDEICDCLEEETAIHI